MHTGVRGGVGVAVWMTGVGALLQTVVVAAAVPLVRVTVPDGTRVFVGHGDQRHVVRHLRRHFQLLEFVQAAPARQD